MSDRPVITAHDWLERALEERLAARTLAGVGLWGQSFHNAGFAVECALKYVIMRKRGWNGWPERARAREFYSHDLVFLAGAAKLEERLAAEADNQTEIGRAWLIVKDWKNELRYDPVPITEKRARDMVDALDSGGFLSWLIET